MSFSPRGFRRSLRRAGITATQYRVAVELCEYAGSDKPEVWPSVAALAADCEVDRSTVIRALNQLEKKGLIACASDRAGGRHRKTKWCLVTRNSGAGATLSGDETVAPQTQRVAPVHGKGRAGATRSRDEVNKEDSRAACPHCGGPRFEWIDEDTVVQCQCRIRALSA